MEFFRFLVGQSAKLLAFKAFLDEIGAVALDGRPIVSRPEYFGSHCSRAGVSSANSFVQFSDDIGSLVGCQIFKEWSGIVLFFAGVGRPDWS